MTLHIAAPNLGLADLAAARRGVATQATQATQAIQAKQLTLPTSPAIAVPQAPLRIALGGSELPIVAAPALPVTPPAPPSLVGPDTFVRLPVVPRGVFVAVAPLGGSESVPADLLGWASTRLRLSPFGPSAGEQQPPAEPGGAGRAAAGGPLVAEGVPPAVEPPVDPGAKLAAQKKPVGGMTDQELADEEATRKTWAEQPGTRFFGVGPFENLLRLLELGRERLRRERDGLRKKIAELENEGEKRKAAGKSTHDLDEERRRLERRLNEANREHQEIDSELKRLQRLEKAGPGAFPR